MKPKLLVATEIKNIDGLFEKLGTRYELEYFPSLSTQDLEKVSDDISAIFTNPNNSTIYFGEETVGRFKSLEHLVTASTGTIHIDREYLSRAGVSLISITNSLEVLETITSTAEHAFLLSLAALRKYDLSTASVVGGRWDYSEFIGRQMNCLRIGVLGFGRLGKMYAAYAAAFGAEVYCCDPHKEHEIKAIGYKVSSLKKLFSTCNLISLHIHATPDNIQLVDSEVFVGANPDLILINTARGEVVNDGDLLNFLNANRNASYHTDVLADEFLGLTGNALFRSDLFQKQIFMTPHCGGMTSDARNIAYHHAADLLLKVGNS